MYYILVNCMHNMPMNCATDVDDVVNMVMFLLSDKSAMTTGTHILVDGGYAAR